MIQEEKIINFSPLEWRFYEACMYIGVKVYPQYKIGPLHADFAIPDRMLAIELDSDMWHSKPEEKLNDSKRDEIYKKFGWKVLRIRGKVVYSADEELAFQIKKGKHDEGGYISYLDDPLDGNY